MSFKVVQDPSDGSLTVVNLITGTTIATITAADVITLNATSVTMTREAIAATGTNAATAAPLTKQVSAVTASNGTKAVALPAAATTTGPLLIINTVVDATLPVFPVSGGNDNINGGAEDAAWTLGAGKAAWFTPVSATQWWVDDISAATETRTELNVLSGVTAGTSAPSKALVTDAAESLAWATTDSTASETCTLTITDTRTGAGATGWAAKFDLESNVALGSYANGAYGYLAFGASGKVTGLAAGVCSETVLSAGCVDGTYAGLEIELGMPANAVCGTATSLIYLSVYGADAGTFDTNGFLFHLAGVTKNTGKMLADTTSGATARPVQVLRVKTPDGTRYLPLYDTVAIAA